jgi:hypothetical protein
METSYVFELEINTTNLAYRFCFLLVSHLLVLELLGIMLCNTIFSGLFMEVLISCFLSLCDHLFSP